MTVELARDIWLHPGDCLEVLARLPTDHFDSCVCDPPYGLEFMGKDWDGADGFRRALNGADVGRDDVFGRASARGPEYRAGHLFQDWCFAWAREVLRVLKPGAHLVAFGATRTYHRLACAIEDAGFEIRDQIAWAYGQGFPKSLDVSKAIDREAGAVREVVGRKTGRAATPINDLRGGQYCQTGDDRYDASAITAPVTDAAKQWDGWGTALKPAWEPICLARKPLSESTVAANVVRWGTGAINVDGCRIATDPAVDDPRLGGNGDWSTDKLGYGGAKRNPEARHPSAPLGRWPANVVTDGSDEVVAGFPSQAGAFAPVRGDEPSDLVDSTYAERDRVAGAFHADSGSAARFFYTAKADIDDRLGSRHPTIKPVDLMQWLCRLVTPAAGLVIDPFAGTGTTGEAAWRERMRAVLIEREAEYQDDIRRRMALMLASTAERRRQAHKQKQTRKPLDNSGTLFG